MIATLEWLVGGAVLVGGVLGFGLARLLAWYGAPVPEEKED